MQVSMLKRVAFCMPPTTGCLESMNGDLNEETPRNNTLRASVATLQRMVFRSMNSFGAHVRCNYNASVCKSINISLNLGDERQRQRQIAFDRSTVEGCPWGQTVHLSAMYSGPPDPPSCERGPTSSGCSPGLTH
jgi:hypothetical protein